MAQSINTNVLALNSQRYLDRSQSLLATAVERLSSGLRINSARDDAAGLAISNRMTAQIRGLNQAIRNANDGISLAQTAEGALGEIGNNLQRLRELAIQSANASNTLAERASLQAEATQLVQEVTRVASQTSFNGLNLIDGSFVGSTFQVGANANQTITVSSVSDARATALGSQTLVADGTITGNVVGAAANGILAETNLVLSNSAGSSSPISYGVNSSAKQIADAINNAASGLGITATATNSVTLSTLTSVGNGDGTVSFTINGQLVSAVVTDQNDLSPLVSAINGVRSSSGVTAAFTSSTSNASITLSTTDGSNISIGTFAVNGASNVSVNVGSTTLTEGGTVDAVKTGTVSLLSTQGQITTAGADVGVFAAAGTNYSVFVSIEALNLRTAAGAQSAIGALDQAMAQIDAARTSLGAVQSRFVSTIASLQVNSENISASRSRIQDTDYAAETAALTRGQILQQAGIAMLAQANALPQTVLSLLRA